MRAQTTAEPPTPPDCLNCFRALPEPRPRFCPACGQETQTKPPTIGEFVQQFGGAYLSTEGALWRTLALLLFKPGELTRRYLAGRRRHYVLPLRLYLTVSVLVLLGLRLGSGVNVDAGAVSLSVSPTRSALVDIGFGRAGVRDGRFFCEELPAWICTRLQRRFDVEPRALERELRQVGERLVANLGAVMFVLLPSFALWLKLLHLGRGLRYTEHLVFALHLHSFWFIAIGLTMFRQNWLSLIAILSIPVYAMLALRRVYGGRLALRLVRAATISMLHLAVLAAALMGVALWSVLF